jgi:hypothetical protein
MSAQDKYDLLKLEAADVLMPLTAEENRLLDTLQNKLRLARKRQQLNISLDQKQFAALEKIANAKHLSPSTLARTWVLACLKGLTSLC